MPTGTEVLAALNGLDRQTREKRVVDLARAGSYAVWPMMQVPCGPGSYFLVTSDYFAVGDELDFVRMPLSGVHAQELADALGMHLMTKKMVDRAWVAAKMNGVVVAPHPMGAPYGAAMETLDRLVEHERFVNADFTQVTLGWRGMLVGGHKKDVVISPKLRERRGWLAFYGWHHPNGVPIQGLNLHAHLDTYADYSHGVRLVAPSMVVNGVSMLVEEVLADPQLCVMLSDEGPFSGVRYALAKENPPMLIIKLGSTGESVKKWQSAMNLSPDGIFGPATDAATRAWQAMHGLTADGVVGPHTWSTWMAIVERPTDPQLAASLPFVQATHCYSGGMGAVKLVVIHTMEWGETAHTAEDCAAMFAGPKSPQASAHYCVDNGTVVQCVKETDGAWHCPGYLAGVEVNRCSIGVEHAGYAKQTPAEWADEYSMKMLRLSAQLVGAICKRHDIPVRRLSKDELHAGEKGLCGHVDVTNATGTGTHWDPGPNFPWDVYLSLVQEYAA